MVNRHGTTRRAAHRRREHRDAGSLLIPALILTMLLGALSGSLVMTMLVHSRSSTEDLDRELAVKSAETGLAYYFGELSLDPDYFTMNPAPHSPVSVGDASFTLDSATAGSGPGLWLLSIAGESGAGIYTLDAAIGNPTVTLPPGIVMAGTGNPSDVIVDLRNSSLIGSYDPGTAPFDPSNPASSGDITLNGSFEMSGTSTVNGNVTASGTASVTSPAVVNGTVTSGGSDTTIESIDAIVTDFFNGSKTSNDNADLTSVFGGLWFPLSGSENYGNLIVDDGGTYVVPAGTYRFKVFEVSNSSKIIFDTSAGPVNLVYVGSGAGTGTGNDLTLRNLGQVLVDSGGTTNGLLTVLGADCDFMAGQYTVFGQNISDPDNAGYTRIISLGGNASSDSIVAENFARVYARLHATAHSLTLSNAAEWYGSAVARTLSMGNNTSFAVDEGMLGRGLVDPTTFQILARWRGASP